MSFYPGLKHKKRSSFWIGLTLILFFNIVKISFGAEFNSLSRVSSDSTGRKYQLSRNQNHSIDFDSKNNLHISYFGDDGQSLQSTSPDNPSYICYAYLDSTGKLVNEIDTIADSYVSGEYVGGRDPSLTVDIYDNVWICWYDFRNCTAGGNWIDNTEIYIDSKISSGSFSVSDTRLVISNPAIQNTNSYIPHLSASNIDGSLTVAWYDFEWDDTSEILVKTSDTSGTFNLGESKNFLRKTNAADRGGAIFENSLWMPSIEIDDAGVQHVIYGQGNFGDKQDLYYMQVAPNGIQTTTTLIASSTNLHFFTPASMTQSSNGDLWVFYAKDLDLQQDNIYLHRKKKGETTFSSPLVYSLTAWQLSPDVEVDSKGIIHLAWIERRSDLDRDVYYASYDPEQSSWSGKTIVTSHSSRWEAIDLTLSPAGIPYICMEENLDNIAQNSFEGYNLAYLFDTAASYKF